MCPVVAPNWRSTTAGVIGRRQEAARRAVEREAAVLPGRALAEACQPLRVTPDRPRIVLDASAMSYASAASFRGSRAASSPPESRRRASREFRGGSSPHHRAIGSRIRIQRLTARRRGYVHASWIVAPTMDAPEPGHVLEAPDDVIRAHDAKQEHVQGEGGGAHVTVPEDEPAEQPGPRPVGRVVDAPVPVHEEEKQIAIAQVRAGWNARSPP